MENFDSSPQRELIERLTALEYAIRRSMPVREDQEDDAERWHVDEARRCGIAATDGTSKGELLGAVQTLVRASQAKLASQLRESR